MFAAIAPSALERNASLLAPLSSRDRATLDRLLDHFIKTLSGSDRA